MKAISRIAIGIAAVGLGLVSATAGAANAMHAGASLGEISYAIVDAAGVSSTPALSSVFSTVSTSVYIHQPFLFEKDYVFGDGIKPITSQTVVEQGQGSARTHDQAGAYTTTANLAPGLSDVLLGSSSQAYFLSRVAFTLPAHATFSFSGLASGYLNREASGQGYDGMSGTTIRLSENFSDPVAMDAANLYSSRMTNKDSYAKTLKVSYTNPGDTDMLMHLDVSGGSVATNIEADMPGRPPR
ncbi:hypothetical protein HSX11_10750 [Oxalobacteraceae bacterium]|nr:hypothetical protein [Oxalobacteraceae bacterium]